MRPFLFSFKLTFPISRLVHYPAHDFPGNRCIYRLGESLLDHHTDVIDRVDIGGSLFISYAPATTEAVSFNSREVRRLSKVERTLTYAGLLLVRLEASETWNAGRVFRPRVCRSSSSCAPLPSGSSFPPIFSPAIVRPTSTSCRHWTLYPDIAQRGLERRAQ